MKLKHSIVVRVRKGMQHDLAQINNITDFKNSGKLHLD